MAFVNLPKRLWVIPGVKRSGFSIISSNNMKRTYNSSNIYVENIINKKTSFYSHYIKISSSRLIGLYQNKHFIANMSTGSASEEFRQLDYEQLNELKKKPGTILIDVRENEELAETGILPGAYHIPLGEVAKALSASDEDFRSKYKFNKPAKDANLIFSCRSGKRSLVALEIALANGYINAKNYKGGFLDWKKHTSEIK